MHQMSLRQLILALHMFSGFYLCAQNPAPSVSPSARSSMGVVDRICTKVFTDLPSRWRSWRSSNPLFTYRNPDHDPLPYFEQWKDKIFVIIPGWGVGNGVVNLQRAYYPLARSLHKGTESEAGVDPQDVHIVGYDHSQGTAAIAQDLRQKLGQLIKNYRDSGDNRKFVAITHSLGSYVGLYAIVRQPYRYRADGTPLGRGESNGESVKELKLWHEFEDFISISGVSPFTGYNLTQFSLVQNLNEFHNGVHGGWHQFVFGRRFGNLNPAPHRHLRTYRLPEEGTTTFEHYIDRIQMLQISSLYSRDDKVIQPWPAAIVPEGNALEIPGMGHISAVAFYPYLYKAFEVAFSPDGAGATYYTLNDIRSLASQNGAQVRGTPN